MKNFFPKFINYKLKFISDYYFLLILIILIFLLNLIWLKIDTLTPHWDMARHLENSNIYLNLINQALKGNFEAFKDIFGTYQYYPPFFYWFLAIWYKIFGNSLDIAITANILPIAVLVCSVYGIGKKLWDRQVGLLAALIVVSMPIFISQMKEVQLDFPLAAIAALAFYLLLLSDEFRNLKFTLWFGVVCGIGMLIKWPFVMFLLGPILIIIIQIIIRKISEYKAKQKINLLELRNLFLAFLIFGLIVSPWYMHNFQKLKADFFGNIAIGQQEGDPGVFTWQSFQYYFWALANNQLYLVWFIPFLIGIGYSFSKKEYLIKNSLMYALIIGSYLGFSLFLNKDVRFTEPILPFVAIIIVYWIFLIKNQILRYLFLGYYLFLIPVLIVSINFGIQQLPDELSFSLNKNNFVVFAQHGYIIGQPINQDWQIEKMLQLINKDFKKNFPKEKIDSIYLLIDDEMRFNVWDFRYYSVKNNYSNAIANSGYKPNYYIISGKAPKIYLSQMLDDLKSLNLSPELIYQSILPNQNQVWIYRLK